MRKKRGLEKKESAKWKNLGWLFAVTILLGSLILPPLGLAEEWPTKTITIICGSAAGAFTDTSSRAIANEMSKIFGVPVLVTNVPGGGGGIAADNTFRAPNDGYTWTSQGAMMRTFGVMGLHSAGPKDWYCLPTVGYFGAISVLEDSPYKTLTDLVEALKKNPGRITFASSQPSTAWRINMEILQKATGLRARYVPFPGSAPSQVALLSRDVEFILTGLGEQAELLKGKRIRSLAVFHDKPANLEGYGEIPPVTKFLPELKSSLPFPAWASISTRADVPKPILRKFDEALLKAEQSSAVREWCEKFISFPMGVAGDEAQKMFLHQASVESWLLYEVGVAKRNPAEFGIPKP